MITVYEKVLLIAQLQKNQVVSVQVFYVLVRSREMYMKIIFHIIVYVFDWFESKPSHNHQFLALARLDLQQKIEDRTNIFPVHGSVSHLQCTEIWPILGNLQSIKMDMALEIWMK